MNLWGGASVTFGVKFRTDANCRVVDYKDTTPGDPLPDEVDILSLTNVTTGRVVM
jgi:hypothetical protein